MADRFVARDLSGRLHHYLGAYSATEVESDCPLCGEWFAQVDMVTITLGTFRGSFQVSVWRDGVAKPSQSSRSTQTRVADAPDYLTSHVETSTEVRRAITIAKLTRESLRVCRFCHTDGMGEMTQWEILLNGDWQTVPFLIANPIAGWELDAMRPCYGPVGVASAVVDEAKPLTNKQRRLAAKAARAAATAGAANGGFGRRG